MVAKEMISIRARLRVALVDTMDTAPRTGTWVAC